MLLRFLKLGRKNKSIPVAPSQYRLAPHRDTSERSVIKLDAGRIEAWMSSQSSFRLHRFHTTHPFSLAVKADMLTTPQPTCTLLSRQLRNLFGRDRHSNADYTNRCSVAGVSRLVARQHCSRGHRQWRRHLRGYDHSPVLCVPATASRKRLEESTQFTKPDRQWEEH